MLKYHYISPEAPALKFGLVVNGKRIRVQFVNGALQTDDDALAAAIDALRAEKPAFSRLVKKADLEAAERMVREHMASLQQRGPLASKGAHTTANSPEAQVAQLHSAGANLDDARAHVAQAAGVDSAPEAGNAPHMLVQTNPPQPPGFQVSPQSAAVMAADAAAAAQDAAQAGAQPAVATENVKVAGNGTKI